MFQLPEGDRARWIDLLQANPVPDVLRQIAGTYSLGRGDLGFALVDLSPDVLTQHVQAVWTWDIERKGRGLNDDELVEELASLRFRLD